MELFLFFAVAAIALIGAIAMILSTNAVHSALFLLLNLAAVSVLFLMLQSPFLFAVQLTVYGGAIMVLFLFVVMLLGAEKAEDSRDRIGWQRPLAILLGLALLAMALTVAMRRSDFTLAAPPDTGYGDPTAIGALLFTEYLLPFEITGVILLVAVIGVVVLSQRRQSPSE